MASGDKKPKKPQMGKPEKSLKARTLASEQRSAKQLQGRSQPASGAGAAHKGDIKLKDFLIDKKETESSAIMVYGKDLTKITREADGEGKTPAILLQLLGVPKTVSGEWVLIPIDKFAELFT